MDHRIGIVGAGVGGLHLALYLQKQGLEPTIITPDGVLGIFFGRTYVLTEGGHEQLTKFPHELIVI